jgi:MFS transporter, SP family, galactose:H+ symporter
MRPVAAPIVDPGLNFTPAPIWRHAIRRRKDILPSTLGDAIAGMAGFLFGFDEGVIAGALHLLRREFTITPVLEGIVTSAVPFGALFGSLVAGWLAESLGRRRSLLVAGTLFVLGAVLAALATGISVLTFARLILGFAIGLAAIVAPLYISENAPADRRGMLVSIYQLAITLGILGAYIVGFAFSESWRTMFLLGAVPGIALVAGIYMMTDTPRWLTSRGRLQEARAAIARVRDVDPQDPGVDRELAAITVAAKTSGEQGRWSELLSPAVRPALIVGVGLFILQQLSGSTPSSTTPPPCSRNRASIPIRRSCSRRWGSTWSMC